MTQADVVLRSGGELDAWLPEVVEQSGTDPHRWHDPRAAEQAVRVIARAAKVADPAGTA